MINRGYCTCRLKPIAKPLICSVRIFWSNCKCLQFKLFFLTRVKICSVSYVFIDRASVNICSVSNLTLPSNHSLENLMCKLILVLFIFPGSFSSKYIKMVPWIYFENLYIVHSPQVIHNFRGSIVSEWEFQFPLGQKFLLIALIMFLLIISGMSLLKTLDSQILVAIEKDLTIFSFNNDWLEASKFQQLLTSERLWKNLWNLLRSGVELNFRKIANIFLRNEMNKDSRTN